MIVPPPQKEDSRKPLTWCPEVSDSGMLRQKLCQQHNSYFSCTSQIQGNISAEDWISLRQPGLRVSEEHHLALPGNLFVADSSLHVRC